MGVAVGDGSGVGEETGVGEKVGVDVTTTMAAVKVGLGVRVGRLPAGLELDLQAIRRIALTATNSVRATRRTQGSLIASLHIFIMSL